MYTSTIAAVCATAAAAMGGMAQASTQPIPAGKTCINQTVPVTISSRNAVFGNLAAPETNLDVTTFIQSLTRQSHNFTNEALTGYNTVSGTYNISTKFCYNANTTTVPTLQILTHGIGFDKSYWDIPYNNYNYSYINSALSAGYATLSYDRLGIGNSSHGEPINEIQSFLEIAALRELTTMMREGNFPSVPVAYPEIVHVGHSFGSAQSYQFASMYPNETQGVVLTGFSMNASFVPYFAAGGNFVLASSNSPVRFGNVNLAAIQQYLDYSPFYDFIQPVEVDTLPPGQNLPNGYIIPSDVEANQYEFFYPPQFDTELLFFSEATKQPVTYGEILTLGSLSMTNNFAGPVLVITGEFDLPYCGGDCFATGGAAASVPASVSKNFPNVPADDFEVYIQPQTGHGINAHYNSTGAYQVISSFLASHGLASK